MNFIFTASYLNKSIQHLARRFTNSKSITQALKILVNATVTITNTFQLLLDKSDKALIISKAAMYCLQYLCDPSHTRKMAQWHLGIRQMDRNHRRTRPLQWHLQASCRDLSKKPVITVLADLISPKNFTLTTYGRFCGGKKYFYYRIFSLHSQQWIDWKPSPYNPLKAQSWSKYLTLLEYLPAILPHAGKFQPLIHLCKTKAFAPLSMMFPDLSRRARRAICAYLDRMDADIVEYD